MAHEYTLLNFITLEAGSWADWFSGTMSALAVTTALVAFPLARRQRRAEEKQRDKELGRSVGWKLNKVMSRTGDISRHFETSLQNPKRLNPSGMKFPFVQPLGVPERPLQELGQSEVDLLLKAQAGDLLAEIEMCIGRYASITYAMKEYKTRHEALYELMPTPVAWEGTKFMHELTREESQRVGPYMAMLDDLIDSMMKLAAENVKRANAAWKLYDAAMTRYFGKPLLTLDIIPEDMESTS